MSTSSQFNSIETLKSKLDFRMTSLQFSQKKLSAKEWQSIEIPLSNAEKEIIELIQNGFSDPSLRFNKMPTINTFIKMTINEELEKKLFLDLFSVKVDTLLKSLSKVLAKNKKNKSATPMMSAAVTTVQIFCRQMESLLETASQNPKQKNKAKKADIIRVNNAIENLTTNKHFILEFLIFDHIELTLESIVTLDIKNTAKSVYTLAHMGKNTLLQRNPWIQSVAQLAIIAGKQFLGGELETAKLVLKYSGFIIEANQDISRCEDKQLYDHQKQLFSSFRGNSAPKLVFYSAATGTGKTLSPLGLSVDFKIIFVCAARHVGLALARSAIALNKSVAFGFGCESSADIRLHFFAAKEYSRDKKTGGIRKVDNAVGDRVEIMICDIQSYEYAMLYMLAFNKKESLVLYWDEPTISLDQEFHELHQKIHNLWSVNQISKVVLSSATLPEPHELSTVISDFKERFSGAEIVCITSQESNKSVSLISRSGVKVTPHGIFGNSEYSVLQDCLSHCAKNPILLKFFDIGELCKLLIAALDGQFSPYLLPNWACEADLAKISTIDNLTICKIKHFYLNFFQQIDPGKWNDIRPMLASSSVAYVPNILFTTEDAATLTDGPSIFIVENVHTIAQFLLQESRIPAEKLQQVQETIDNNGKHREIYDKLRRNLEDLTAEDMTKERKMAKESVRSSPAVTAINSQLENLAAQIKEVTLDKCFIPNSRAHQAIWASTNPFNPHAFTTHLDAGRIEMVMNLSNVSNCWKILLLMGIGMFPKEGTSEEESLTTEYLEVMKMFANEQKLFLIIAASDYIFGLNYNFCHGILGRDLSSMTQQKATQACGRIGRFNDDHKYTLRLRDDALVNILFLPQKTNLEATNFCRLFVAN